MCPTSERYHHHRSGYRTGLAVIEERHVNVGLDFLPHRENLCGPEATVPHLSPTTLTTDEQRAILRATVSNVRDHTIISLALGTGLRLAEIVGGASTG